MKNSCKPQDLKHCFSKLFETQYSNGKIYKIYAPKFKRDFRKMK